MNKQDIIGKTISTIAYIGLLLLFAHSLFFKELIKESRDVIAVYNLLQSSWSSYITNIGLLFMLLIDYTINKRLVPRWILTGSVVMFGLLAVVYYFASLADDVQSFIKPLSSPYFGIIIYMFFIGYLLIIKYVSITDTITKDPIKKL